MPKIVVPDLKPLPYESYYDWRRRRMRAWAKKMTYSDRKKINDFIARLTLYQAENSKRRRTKDGVDDSVSEG